MCCCIGCTGVGNDPAWTRKGAVSTGAPTGITRTQENISSVTCIIDKFYYITTYVNKIVQNVYSTTHK